MNLKNEKGVTLIVLTITIIVLLIITGIMISNSKSQLAIKKVNNLYADIDAISTKVSDYYLKNNSLPVFSNVYLNSSNELGLLLIANGGERSVINSNDDGPYYVLDLSKLDNLTLNYGKDYQNWNDASTFQTYQDLYIINGVTYQIYYPKGITYDGETYFTKKVNSYVVDKIQTTSISDDEFKLTSIVANKNETDEENKVIINANIKLNLTENLNSDTLKFAWETSSDSNNIEYTNFSVDSLNSANIMSKIVDDTTKYYLNLSILDINGELHKIQYEVTFNTKESLPTREGTIPYYPDEKEFEQVPGTDLDTGLVIKDKNQNEYVWIEVPTTIYSNTTYNSSGNQKPTSSEDYANIAACLEKYTNDYLNSSYADTNESFTTQYQNMLKSIYINGGFWIGRYETGIEGNVPRSSHTETSEKVVIQQNKLPYNYVTRDEAQTLAQGMKHEGCTTSLMFGLQWDLILKYIETKKIDTDAEIKNKLTSKSTELGNYYDNALLITNQYAKYSKNDENSFYECPYQKKYGEKVLLTTGADTSFSLMNIYDLAGNLEEWTLETRKTRNLNIARGGCIIFDGDMYAANTHCEYDIDTCNYYIGFRIGIWKIE